jgi:hypothetical protein
VPQARTTVSRAGPRAMRLCPVPHGTDGRATSHWESQRACSFLRRATALSSPRGDNQQTCGRSSSDHQLGAGGFPIRQPRGCADLRRVDGEPCERSAREGEDGTLVDDTSAYAADGTFSGPRSATSTHSRPSAPAERSTIPDSTAGGRQPFVSRIFATLELSSWETPGTKLGGNLSRYCVHGR